MTTATTLLRRYLDAVSTLTGAATLDEAVHRITVYGRPLRVIENPNSGQIKNLLSQTHSLRMIVDEVGDLFVWDATASGTHAEVSNQLGLDWAVMGFITKRGIGLPPHFMNDHAMQQLQRSRALSHAMAGRKMRVFTTDEA